MSLMREKWGQQNCATIFASVLAEPSIFVYHHHPALQKVAKMFVVLCGGFERDAIPGTYPRPLNMIFGYPQLHYTLRDLAPTCTSILFIYSMSLKAHYFEETVRALFPSVQCLFAVTQFATRGPVETALAGVLQADFPESEPLVFLDNDNAYPSTLSASIVGCSKAPFVGYDVRHSSPSVEGNPEGLAYLTLGERGASGMAPPHFYPRKKTYL
jgi:hypothetical protein